MKPLPRFLALSAALLTATTLSAESKSSTPAGNPASAPAISAAGTWQLQVDTGQGTGGPTFTFKQDGETLSGRYKGLFGEAPVTGALKGREIRFSVKVSAQGQEITITYSGTLEGDTMKGKVAFGDAGEGSFTGKRSGN
ncbi:MAG TPA: hypothetical protein VHN79_10555 [Lacunisphaera sp.]|nr:hypothetical protein [Lacunisphaera sp.]